MTEYRLVDYLEQMRESSTDALSFVERLTKDSFLSDKLTQRAVVMSLIIIGEAATKTMERFPDFVAKHPEIAWRGMRGLRNRIAHGYFDLDLDVVWATLKTALPELLEQLKALSEN